MEIERIKERAQKLFAQAQGEARLGNDAAAANFMALLQRMLAQHRLGMEDLGENSPKETFGEEELGMPDEHDFRSLMAQAVGELYGVFVMVRDHPFSQRKDLVFVGTETARGLAMLVTRAVWDEAKARLQSDMGTREFQLWAACNGDGAVRRWYAGWRTGFIQMLWARIIALKEAPGEQTAVALIADDYEAAREYAHKNNTIEGPTPPRGFGDDQLGIAYGARAAHAVNLSVNGAPGGLSARLLDGSKNHH